jgi:hypothetical protein
VRKLVRTLDEIIQEMINELKTKGIDVTDFNSNPVIYTILKLAHPKFNRKNTLLKI